MSELTQENENANYDPSQEGDAPVVEVETGPLLPLWGNVLLYALFGGLAAIAAVWIPMSMVRQHQTWNMLQLIMGPWEDDPPSMESQEMGEALRYYLEDPVNSLLYVNQELVRDDIDDERIARAETLRKARVWEEEITVRKMLDEIIANMDSEGVMPPDYELPPEYQGPLERLIQRRREEEDDSYEARQVTEVLQWLADGRPTEPLGHERRRLIALREGFEKRLFVGVERRQLRNMIREWSEKGNELQRGLAEKFQLMLDEEHVELNEEEDRFCKEKIEELEASFTRGQRRLSEFSLALVRTITEEGIFIDHPQIYEFCYLLKITHPPTLQNIKQALFYLRRRNFTLMFLAYALRQDEVNPVLAVETDRLTADEHRRLLRGENISRRRSAIAVMERIAIDFYEDPFRIERIEDDEREDFVRSNTVAALGRFGEDPDVGDRATEALDNLREKCPDWF